MNVRWLVCGLRGWLPVSTGAAIRLFEDRLELTPDEQPLVHQSGLWSHGTFFVAAVKIDTPASLRFGGEADSESAGPFASIKIVGEAIVSGAEETIARFDPGQRGWRVVGRERLWKEVVIAAAVPEIRATRHSALSSELPAA